MKNGMEIFYEIKTYFDPQNFLFKYTKYWLRNSYPRDILFRFICYVYSLFSLGNFWRTIHCFGYFFLQRDQWKSSICLCFCPMYFDCIFYVTCTTLIFSIFFTFDLSQNLFPYTFIQYSILGQCPFLWQTLNGHP